MRRLLITLLSACLLGISAGPVVVGQSPSPDSVGFGKRVEVPEMGFAATFPEGWVVETIFGEARVVSPDGSTVCLPAGHRADEPIADPVAFLDQIAAMFPGFADSGPMPIVDTAEVALPAGRAIRFIADYALDDGLAEGYDARYATTYILTDGRVLLFLSCWAPERPDDDWRFIADTIEFLAAEE